MKVPDLNQLFMQAPVAICIVSGKEYKVELANERMLQFLGRTIDIVGHPLQNTLTEAREQGLLSIIENVQTTGQTITVANFAAVLNIDGVREPRYFNLIFKPFDLGKEADERTGVFCVAHNVTEAVLAHQKLEEEKQRTALALDTGGLGMLSTNWQSNTVLADKRAAELFGLEGDQPLDAFLERIHPDDRQKRQAAIREGMAHGGFDFEARLLFPDQSIRWIRSRGMIQKNSEGAVTGSFGVVQDITAQKEFALTLHKEVEQRTADLEKANASLQKLNTDLLRSNAALEEFARAASHDLKEPVRKMQVFTSRLKEVLVHQLTSRETDLFDRMERAAERMGLLVDDLLEYSQLDSLPAREENIDLNQKLSHILQDLELLIAEKGAIIEVGPLPTIRGQRRQVQQLFQNLLTNSLKYARPGVPPVVTIRSSLVDAASLPPGNGKPTSGSFHLIQVEDNGIGFQQADAEKIFQLFARLHGKEDYSGTGIGLSIAKKVVENLGGYIYGEGKPDQGARFTILLPAVGMV